MANVADDKIVTLHVEDQGDETLKKEEHALQLKSGYDDLGLAKTAWRFKKVQLPRHWTHLGLTGVGMLGLHPHVYRCRRRRLSNKPER
jgi:hypothetical protein